VISMFAHKKWMRHTAMVPKGFLRYHVLEALNEKPMSGSEIIEEIEKHTGGSWKPSPGSIYPLLAWLQDNGHVKELPTEDGLKRYELTSSGKALLEEQKAIRLKFRETIGFLPEPFLDIFTRMPPEKCEEIRSAMRKFSIAFFKVGSTLQEKMSQQALNEALKTLDEMTGKLEGLSKRIKGDQNE